MACPPAAVTARSVAALQKLLETEGKTCASHTGLSRSTATAGPALHGVPGPQSPEGAAPGSCSPGKLWQLADRPAGVGIVSIRHRLISIITCKKKQVHRPNGKFQRREDVDATFGNGTNTAGIAQKQNLYMFKKCICMGFPGGGSGKESMCQYRRQERRGLNPWVGKTPWRRAWQPAPVLLPGEAHGQRNLVG